MTETIELQSSSLLDYSNDMHQENKNASANDERYWLKYAEKSMVQQTSQCQTLKTEL